VYYSVIGGGTIAAVVYYSIIGRGTIAHWCTAEFGDCFAAIGVREPQPQASEAFSHFGYAHQEVEKYAVKMVKKCRPVSRWR
jgi:hypothetical protein